MGVQSNKSGAILIISSMGVVVLPTLIISYAVAYIFRDSGVPIPGGTFDFWGILVDNKPKSLSELAFENFATWFVVYGVASFLMYVKPQRSLFHPFKLNPSYPSGSLVMKEALRSLRGVGICTLYCAITHKLYSTGALPTTPLLANDGAVSLLTIVLGAALQYLWADCHFYWTHRLLHTQWFYKSVHKVHHESYNPDPFSGLSMHWFESCVYFSSAPILAMVTPLYTFRTLAIGLIVFPLEGHWGFGNWDNEGSINHYIHHSKFNWNYGSSPMWDHIMGTNYKQGEKKEREAAAVDQANLVGCNIGQGLKDVSKQKTN